MNNKPNDIKKSETLNINLSKRSKDYITKKAIAKKCSRSDLLVDCAYSAHERRTKRDKDNIKNAVIKQNLINIIHKKCSVNDDYMEYLDELMHMEELSWQR
jgi:hypothetical protein